MSSILYIVFGIGMGNGVNNTLLIQKYLHFKVAISLGLGGICWKRTPSGTLHLVSVEITVNIERY